MPTSTHISRDDAVRAALHRVGELLFSDGLVCVKLHSTVSMISLFELRGRRQVVLARFAWKERR